MSCIFFAGTIYGQGTVGVRGGARPVSTVDGGAWTPGTAMRDLRN
jgi:hypothetical protein